MFALVPITALHSLSVAGRAKYFELAETLKLFTVTFVVFRFFLMKAGKALSRPKL